MTSNKSLGDQSRGFDEFEIRKSFRAAPSTPPFGYQEGCRMKLTGLAFRAVANSKKGSMNTDTIMRFTSDDGSIIGNYRGGTIVAGHVLAKWLAESEIEMLYQGATIAGEVQAVRHMDDSDRMQMVECQCIWNGSG